MNFYYGEVDTANHAWGFLEETDNRAWEDAAHTILKPTMIFLTKEQWQQVLSEQSRGRQIVGYGGQCFTAEQGRYYVDQETGAWCMKTDEEFNSEKAQAKQQELVNKLYEIKAGKAYGGVVINNLLVFETNQTAITNTVASLALMSDTGSANWKFYTTAGVPTVQQVTKAQLAGIAQFAQAMINQCFQVEGTFNVELQGATVAQLIDSEWVDDFVERAQTAMDAISHDMTVALGE